MRTIISIMMAILIVIMPTMAIAQEAASTPAFRDCPYNTTDSLVCMACAVYFEARSESHTGRIAVAAVVMNRIHSGRFPTSVCRVVHQPGQFSWLRPSIYSRVRLSQPLWNSSIQAARAVLDGDYQDPSNGALFFHNKHVSMGSAKRVVAVIGLHVFKK